jgi:hypothetical protein
MLWAMSPFGTSRHFAAVPNLAPIGGMADIAYLDEPTTIGPKGSGGPAVASFFASASICPTPLPNGSLLPKECPLIEIDRKRPAHDQSYAIDPTATLPIQIIA